MSYNVEELFHMEKHVDGYAVFEYLKKDDPTITELEIPAEYNGKPVSIINASAFARSKYITRAVIPPSVRFIEFEAFADCRALESVELCEGLEIIGTFAFAGTNLKRVVLPKSLKQLRVGAFSSGPELESVELNSDPTVEPNAFGNCPKLPPETVIMGLVCSTQITMPVYNGDFPITPEDSLDLPYDCFRPDVFDLLAKNNCFRCHDLKGVFCQVIDENKPELLSIAERHGMLVNARLIDKLTEYSTERQRVECTAFLLDLKKQTYGFNGGDDFEL